MIRIDEVRDSHHTLPCALDAGFHMCILVIGTLHTLPLPIRRT